MFQTGTVWEQRMLADSMNPEDRSQDSLYLQGTSILLDSPQRCQAGSTWLQDKNHIASHPAELQR